MPYKSGPGDTVIKADTGKVVGHTKNKKKYLAALYANVPDAHRESGKKLKKMGK